MTSEQRLNMYLGEILYNNNPGQITKDTPEELADKILSDYENALEVVDEIERLGIDMTELRKEFDIDD
ncbi:hypothetical protein [Ligilactobacillus saerimneri]|uniref:hypothetical protein n=1 Tax=Ligilactobacillus saerimneri TaxID=228229 RepID=UPI0024BBA14E|nr:hypothetical protein [Ligilactobacillus saerimneri]